jgi:hypothetical protein
MNFILFLITFSFYNVNSQKMETWIMGTQYADFDPSKWIFHDTSTFNNNHNNLRGGNIVSFKNNNVSSSRHKNSLSLYMNNVNMCDSFGNLLFYCNGSKIFNNKHLLIEGGDSLNYSKYWQTDTPNSKLYFYSSIVDLFIQNTIALKHPYKKNQYYIISTYYDWGNNYQDQRAFTKIQYSIVDMSLNNGLGRVIEKEKEITSGNFAQGVYACRKSDGHNWWLLIRHMDNTNCFTRISIDSLGFSLKQERECIGFNLYSKINTDSIFNITGGNFSNNGKHFAFLSYKGIELFDFDRCAGKLSNLRKHDYPLNDTNYNQSSDANIGLPIFSPNNQYLYVIYSNRIYQYEVNSSNFTSSKIRIATYDGFVDRYEPDTNYVGWHSNFWSAQLGIDNKIYIGTGEDTRYLHLIDSPNIKGLGCKMKQHAIKLLTFKRGVPYYPNYSLGADTCAGSGIQSSEDSHQWSVYPNPASDYVEVPIAIGSHQWAVSSGVELYNLLGQKTSPIVEVTRDWLRLDVRDLPEGIYLLQLRAKTGSVIATEKLVIAR